MCYKMTEATREFHSVLKASFVQTNLFHWKSVLQGKFLWLGNLPLTRKMGFPGINCWLSSIRSPEKLLSGNQLCEFALPYQSWRRELCPATTPSCLNGQWRVWCVFIIRQEYFSTRIPTGERQTHEMQGCTYYAIRSISNDNGDAKDSA